MNTTLKYSLIIVSTLLIGFILGFLVNGRLTHHRMEKMKESFSKQGFSGEFLHMLRLTPDQMEQLQPILKKYGEENRQMMERNREEQRLIFQNLEEEITPYLTAGQIERLEKFKTHWHKKRGHGRVKKR